MQQFIYIYVPSGIHVYIRYIYICTANPTWGDIFESSKLKAQKSLLPRFSGKRRSSFEL